MDKNVPKKKIDIIRKKLKGKKLFILLINANVKNKNQKTTNKILEILLNKNFSREDMLISIGGGITGDIAGYAASLFKRGLKFINIPTTLLAQVDSSIGGKTGVNTKQGLEFFEAHKAADVIHRVECEKLLDGLSKEEQEKAEQASMYTARYLWNFLSGMVSKHKLQVAA